jgi:hypothetical protein
MESHHETSVVLPKAIEARPEVADSAILEANLELWKLIWYLPEPVEYHPGALERDHRAFVALSKAVEAHHGSMKAYPGALEANFVALEAIFKASWSHTG